MKCPYCHLGIKLDIKEQFAYPDDDFSTTSLGKEITHGFCPECDNLVVLLRIGKYRWIEDGGEVNEIQQEIVIYPKVVLRSLEPEIPELYRNMFNEANAILLTSPKASAALSRRLLQQVLQDEYHIVERTLSKEIDQFIALPDIPSDLAEEVDAIRIIGNFAAHPPKDRNTAVICDVEGGEAEWLLDVLEDLFEYTFVRPKRKQMKKDKLNNKLAALNLNAMKTHGGIS